MKFGNISLDGIVEVLTSRGWVDKPTMRSHV